MTDTHSITLQLLEEKRNRKILKHFPQSFKPIIHAPSRSSCVTASSNNSQPTPNSHLFDASCNLFNNSPLALFASRASTFERSEGDTNERHESRLEEIAFLLLKEAIAGDSFNHGWVSFRSILLALYFVQHSRSLCFAIIAYYCRYCDCYLPYSFALPLRPNIPT